MEPSDPNDTPKKNFSIYEPKQLAGNFSDESENIDESYFAQAKDVKRFVTESDRQQRAARAFTDMHSLIRERGYLFLDRRDALRKFLLLVL